MCACAEQATLTFLSVCVCGPSRGGASRTSLPAYLKISTANISMATESACVSCRLVCATCCCGQKTDAETANKLSGQLECWRDIGTQ